LLAELFPELTSEINEIRNQLPEDGRMPRPTQTLLDTLSAHPEFRLRTNPFARSHGWQRGIRLSAGSLAPHQRIGDLASYFDHYDWKDKDVWWASARPGSPHSPRPAPAP